jgi:hypothetical protein
MKKIFLYISLPIVLGSCIKQLDKKFTGAPVVEIDATPLNSVATGVTYPVITRIPTDAKPIVNSRDSSLRRWNGTVKIRVNLVGPQMAQDQTVGYKIFTTSPVATIAYAATLTAAQAPPTGQTPSAAAATLNVLPAIEGTHFEALSGKVTIPANSSFGYINVVIRNNGATAGQARFLGIQLDSTGTLLPNPNYNKLGLTIDQR